MPGCGKTTFMGSIPKSILLDFEGEARFLVAPQAKILTITDGNDFQDIIDWLCAEGPKGSGFSTVSIDTLNLMVRYCIPHLTNQHNNKIRAKTGSDTGGGRLIDDIREYGQGGAGWGKINDYFLLTFLRLKVAGYGICASGHCRTETVEDVSSTTGSRTVIRSTLNPGVLDYIQQMTQFCCRIRHGLTTETVPLKNAKGEVVSSEITKTRRYLLDLLATSSSPQSEAIVKARLVQFFLAPGTPMKDFITVDITGNTGWIYFAGQYTEACARAKASVTEQAQKPLTKENS
ncbi:AAA family ATPase [Candidatus Magnetobacterium casensis]|uniref:AAA family ATPase n=2 Tax=Candidatus Magnetobacterium casense TaxID=1455061 RepID=A0ABS6S190_9BACT|nr:AAA family ATPase [Candidatus Magnetobacterium casensis]